MLTRVLYVALIVVATTSPVTAAPNAADLATLADYLSGAFDSETQNTAQIAGDIPESDLHTRVTMLQRPVDVAGFGPYVLYNQEYRDGDPAKIIRQRLITIELDSDQGAIRMRQYFFNEPAAYLDAHLDPAMLSGITPEDVWLLPGCDVFWQRDGDTFVGGMKDKACAFSFPDGARSKTVIYKVSINADTFWRTDRSVWTDSGEVSGGRSDDEPTIHDRVTAPWD